MADGGFCQTTCGHVCLKGRVQYNTITFSSSRKCEGVERSLGLRRRGGIHQREQKQEKATTEAGGPYSV